MQFSQHLLRQRLHLPLGASRMRGDEVGDQLIGQLLPAANAVEIRVELFEQGERRFAHQFQYVLLGVFGRHFEPARGVVFEHRLQIGRPVEQVVTDAAADKGFLDAFDGADFLIQSQQRPVVVVEVGARLRVEARRAAALAAQFAVAAAHAVHVGRGGPDIGEIPLEPRHFRDFLHLGQYRTFAARVDELALMGRDGAERAASETAAVDVHRVFDHLPRRDVALARIARMRGPFVGEVE